MKAKIFVFGTDPEQNRLFDFMIANTFQSITDADDILYFPGVRDAAAEITGAFQTADTVLFFADESVFAEVKHILCRALGVKLQIDPTLLQRAADSGLDVQNDTAAAICHAGIPEKGVPFALSDGCYSGFGMRRSRQTLAVLPVGESRTGKLLAEQVIPFLNARCETPLPTDYAAHIYAYLLEERLRDTDIIVSVSDTKTTALFRRYISSVGRLQDHMPVAAKAEQRGSIPPNEYVVNLSLTAAEFFHAPYGIAMSNAYYTGEDESGEKKVYLAVTSAEDSTVREITSFYGESTEEFLERCCGEMCLLADQVIDTETAPAPLVAAEEKHDKNKRFHLIFSIILALLAVVFSIGIWYFMANDYSLKDWAATYLPFVFSGNEPESATAVNASAGAIEAVVGESKTQKPQTTKPQTEAATTERPDNLTASPTLPAYYFTTEEESEEEPAEDEEENGEAVNEEAENAEAEEEDGGDEEEAGADEAE